MTMRMQELARQSGLPRTAIHHYVREGLLPPAHKTAPNAARYEQAHLDRLELISRLRSDDGDGRPLSIPEIHRVLEHVDAGAELRVAVRLVEEGVEPTPTEGGTWRTPAELAAAAGLATGFVEALVAAELVGGGRDEAPFTPADLLVARACEAACANPGVEPPDLTPLADLLREVGNYSATLADVHAARAAASADDPATAEPQAGRLDRDLAALCDVLLWRVMKG